jgi:hypothetical protein
MINFTNEQIREFEKTKALRDARFKRLLYRIKSKRKQECEKMNFNPDIISTLDDLIAYANLLEEEVSITRKRL